MEVKILKSLVRMIGKKDLKTFFNLISLARTSQNIIIFQITMVFKLYYLF